MDIFRREYKKGESIFCEGDPSENAYIIESGTVEISVLRQKEKTILSTLREDELFGEIALLDGNPRTATAIALTNTIVFVVNSEQIKERLKSVDPLIAMLLNLLLERLRSTHELWNHKPHLPPVIQDVIKRRSKNYDGEIKQEAISTLIVENRLRRAIKNNELELHYQPIVSFKDSKTVGFEALLRWRNEAGELIPPGSFIDTSEESGLIIPIGYWIIEQAAKDLAKFNSTYKKQYPKKSPLFMSINISGKQFGEDGLVNKIVDIVNKSPSDSTNIVLEITENALIGNVEDAIALLKQARDAGFKIALDDFGTGYSSLNYLHRFPIDILKIDRDFIINMLKSKGSMGIVKTIVSLGKNLNLNLVAEGLEHREECEEIKKLKCDWGQGYFYSKPLSVSDALTWLSHKPTDNWY